MVFDSEMWHPNSTFIVFEIQTRVRCEVWSWRENPLIGSVYCKGDKKGEVCVSILVGIPSQHIGLAMLSEAACLLAYSTRQETMNGATKKQGSDGYPCTPSNPSYASTASLHLCIDDDYSWYRSSPCYRPMFRISTRQQTSMQQRKSAKISPVSGQPPSCFFRL